MRIGEVEHRHVFLRDGHAPLEAPGHEGGGADQHEQHDGGNDSNRSFHGNVLNMRRVICRASASVHITTAASANFM